MRMEAFDVVTCDTVYGRYVDAFFSSEVLSHNPYL
jgi:hypothetical protein